MHATDIYLIHIVDAGQYAYQSTRPAGSAAGGSSDGHMGGSSAFCSPSRHDLEQVRVKMGHSLYYVFCAVIRGGPVQREDRQRCMPLSESYNFNDSDFDQHAPDQPLAPATTWVWKEVKTVSGGEYSAPVHLFAIIVHI